MKAKLRRGLYAVTAPPRDGDLIAAAAAALRGGASTLQYRDKGGDRTRRREEAAALAALCRRHNALFIVNDDTELAREVGAGGVHLGRDDGAVAAARRVVGEEAVIGVSCYADLARAERAAAEGADYLAFGSLFPSATKPDAVRAPLDLPAEARRRTGLPVVGIGGIDADNIGRVAAAGIDAAAVISALFGADDVEAAARQLTAAFGSPICSHDNQGVDHAS